MSTNTPIHLPTHMSIATKAGDKGTSSLIGGVRVRKDDPRIEAYGTVDELNAVVGLCLNYATASEVIVTLNQVQHHLFSVGAELASLGTPNETTKIKHSHVEFLEEALYKVESSLPQQKHFILPNGTKAASYLHLARTICRRAERRAVVCANIGAGAVGSNQIKNQAQNQVNSELVRYLNRLSDLLFLFARLENNQANCQEEKVKYE